MFGQEVKGIGLTMFYLFKKKSKNYKFARSKMRGSIIQMVVMHLAFNK